MKGEVMRKYSAWCRKCDKPALIGLTSIKIHTSGSDEEHLSESEHADLKIIIIECKSCLSDIRLDVEDVITE